MSGSFLSSAGFAESRREAVGRLLECRVAGHWQGRLSSSALSTATAITALRLVDERLTTTDHAARITAGARWLATREGGAGPWTRATITVANGAANVAFLVRLRIVPSSGATPGAPDPAPVFFSANYLVLRRGETRVVLAEFADAILNGAAPAVAWDFGGGGALS